MDFWQSFPAVTSFSSGSWPAELFQSVTFIATKGHVLFGFIKFPLTLQRADQTRSCREREANPSSFFQSIQHCLGLYLKALPRFIPHNVVSVKKKIFFILIRNRFSFAMGKSSGVAHVSMTRCKVTNESAAWVRKRSRGSQWGILSKKQERTQVPQEPDIKAKHPLFFPLRTTFPRIPYQDSGLGASKESFSLRVQKAKRRSHSSVAAAAKVQGPADPVSYQKSLSWRLAGFPLLLALSDP